jgi:hypothetical protein
MRAAKGAPPQPTNQVPTLINVEPRMGTHPKRFPAAPRISTGALRNKINAKGGI